MWLDWACADNLKLSSYLKFLILVTFAKFIMLCVGEQNNPPRPPCFPNWDPINWFDKWQIKFQLNQMNKFWEFIEQHDDCS